MEVRLAATEAVGELREHAGDGARLARPVFADDDGVRSNDELLLGAESYASAKPGESIYPASCGLDVERYVPLDEALSRVVIDLSGRPACTWTSSSPPAASVPSTPS